MNRQTAHAGLTLEIVDPSQNHDWDNFVSSQPEASVYHTSNWIDSIRQTYNYQPCCLLARKEGDQSVYGALPMMFVDSFVTGKRLVSLPFTTYSDALGEMPAVERVNAFLHEHYPSARDIQFKRLHPTKENTSNDERPAAYLTHILDLSPGSDAIYKNFHNSSIRQRIRRAEREGLQVTWKNSEEGLRNFYDLLVGVRKKHGLPPPPYAFYRHLWQNLSAGDMISLPVVTTEDNLVAAAAVVLHYGRSVHLEYSASDGRFLKQGANQLLIWNAIQWAFRRDAAYFDFGRSAPGNKALISFKERWGAVPRPLEYVSYPEAEHIDADEGPVRQIFEQINRRLPERVLQWEGNLIYRHIA